MTKPAPREGALVTYLDGNKIGRVTFHDDGDKISSDIAFAGKAFQTVITRSPRHVRVEATGKGDEKDVPEGTAVLENGDWQAYALAAEWFDGATEAKAIHVLLPMSGVTIDGTIRVRPRKEGGKMLDLAIKDTLAHVEIDADGLVRVASVPSQRIEVRREGDPPPGKEVRPAPASVDESAYDAASGKVALSGTLWMPKGVDKPPVALIVAGSGPTDREGNSLLGLRSDAYRMLAEALAARGVATVRFDKRGVGKSPLSFDPTKVVLEDFVGDAAVYLDKLKKDGRFSSVGVVGHSEGGLIGVLLAERAPLDALVLVSTPGRAIGTLLHEQLARSLDPKLVAAADKAMAAIRLGMVGEPLPPELANLFAPAVRPFLRSELDLDAALHFKKSKALKAAIVQGERDLQITVADAKLLAESRPDAKLTLIPVMNHALKDEPSAKQPQLSYVDPSMPLAPGLVEAVAAPFGR